MELLLLITVTAWAVIMIIFVSAANRLPPRWRHEILSLGTDGMAIVAAGHIGIAPPAAAI